MRPPGWRHGRRACHGHLSPSTSGVGARSGSTGGTNPAAFVDGKLQSWHLGWPCRWIELRWSPKTTCCPIFVARRALACAACGLRAALVGMDDVAIARPMGIVTEGTLGPVFREPQQSLSNLLRGTDAIEPMQTLPALRRPAGYLHVRSFGHLVSPRLWRDQYVPTYDLISRRWPGLIPWLDGYLPRVRDPPARLMRTHRDIGYSLYI